MHAHIIQIEVVGQAAMPVECEACHAGYVYAMRRTAAGQATVIFGLFVERAQRRAERAATRSLARKFERECEVVPCPACGWVQPAMVAKAHRDRQRSANWFGVGLFGAAVILCVPTGVGISDYTRGKVSLATPVGFGLAATLAGLGALSVPVRRWALDIDYDPNAAAADERIAEGRRLALTRAEFERDPARLLGAAPALT